MKSFAISINFSFYLQHFIHHRLLIHPNYIYSQTLLFIPLRIEGKEEEVVGSDRLLRCSGGLAADP